MDFIVKHYKTLLAALLLGISLWLISAHANPQGGQVAEGSATIEHTGNKTTIHQTSHKAVINWDTFNIAPHEHTHFQQPSSSAIALNRVNANYGASQILGKLTATGQVWIVNPAGIFFGANAIVDVAGLVATTANITNQDFMSGKYTFKNVPGWNGAIINQGRIQVKENGIVALVGPAVINAGVIEARLGQVALAAGKEFTIDFYGDRLINFGTDAKITEPVYDQNGQVIKDAVRNSGQILADGGKVLITADAAHAVLDNVINMDGLIDANTIEQKHGEIVIHGGNEGIVNVSGTLSAKGEEPGETGGSIKVLGDKVGIFAGAELNASGISGGGEILIGGDYKGLGTIPTATATFVDRDTLLDASALLQGNGGRVIVWADNITRFFGNINARGGDISGNGGFVEVSGKENLIFDGLVDASALNGDFGTLLLDPKNIVIAAAGVNYNAGVNNLFANDPSGTVTMLNTSLNTGANIVLQANSDIDVDAAINLTTNGASLTMQAGKDININANITTTNGAINITANDSNADVTNRGGGGAGDITVAAGVTIDSQGGDVNIIIDPETAGQFNPGSITLDTINTNGGTLLIDSPNALNLNSTINTGTGTVDIYVNKNCTVIILLALPPKISLFMNTGSSITTSGADVNITVNTFCGGGTGGASLRNIITNGGDITVATFSTGRDIILEDNHTLSSGGGNISLTSGDDVTLEDNSSINAGAGTVTILANQDASGSDDFTMNTGSSITTTNGNVDIEVNADSGGGGSAALRNITTNGGDISVNIFTGKDITLEDNQILSSSGGNITLTSDNDVILENNSSINAGVGTVTILANQDASGADNFTMNPGSSINTNNTAVNITVNTAAGGDGSATLETILAGDLSINTFIGNININGTLGNIVTPLNSLTIVNANDVTNNSIIYTGTFDQQAGSGTTYLGTIAPGGGTNVTGASVIKTNNVTGYIYTGSLSLLTNAANIFGLIAGCGGQGGADAIVLLNIIGPGTHFFDGIDLFKAPNPLNMIPKFIIPDYPQDLVNSWLLDERFNTDVTAINKPKMCTGLRALFWDCLRLLIKRRK